MQKEITAVEFRVAEDRYALPLDPATKVIPLSEHDVRAGRVDFEGRDLPILNSADALGLGSEGVQRHRRGLVLSTRSDPIVLAVDDVLGIRNFDGAKLRDAPTFFPATTAGLVEGLLTDSEPMLIVLSAERLLASNASWTAADE